MWMLRRPRQHAAGDAEIVVLAGQAFVDNAGLANLCLKICKLLKGLPAHGIIDKANQIGLQPGLKKFEEIARGPASCARTIPA
jgi:hypothetical protein